MWFILDEEFHPKERKEIPVALGFKHIIKKIRILSCEIKRYGYSFSCSTNCLYSLLFSKVFKSISLFS